MRKLLCGIALGAFLALGANLASAQSTETSTSPPAPGGWHHGPMNPAFGAQHLAKRLDLTSEQQTQVQSSLTEEQAQHKALDTNQTITHQQFLAQSKSLHEASETKIQALLNDNQKAEYAKMLARGPHGPPPSESEAAAPQQ
jgi:protein CpxP